MAGLGVERRFQLHRKGEAAAVGAYRFIVFGLANAQFAVTGACATVAACSLL